MEGAAAKVQFFYSICFDKIFFICTFRQRFFFFCAGGAGKAAGRGLTWLRLSLAKISTEFALFLIQKKRHFSFLRKKSTNSPLESEFATRPSQLT